jgi:hypothetical protein
MQCLYCGKPLSLLREFTDGEFCSARHRQRYGKLSRLALGQLYDMPPAAAAFQPPEVTRPPGLRPLPSAPPLRLAFSGRYDALLPTDNRSRGPESEPTPIAMGQCRPRAGKRLTLSLASFGFVPARPSLEGAVAVSCGPEPEPSAGPRPAAIVGPEPHLPTIARLAAGTVLGALPPAEEPTLRPASVLALRLPASLPLPAAHAFQAEPLVFHSQVVRRLPAALQLSVLDAPVATSTGIVSHSPCTRPLALPLSAQAATGCCVPMSGTAWHPWTVQPVLSVTSCSPALDANLVAAAPRIAAPRAVPAAALARGVEPQALAAPRMRMPVLRVTPVSLTLRAEDSVVEEVPGTDLSADLAAGASDLDLVSTSLLPALASLFKYGRTGRAAQPMPPVVEGIAPQNRPGILVACTELPMPALAPRIPRNSHLRIVETFEYLRPLEEPSFDLLQSLARLWSVAPAYLRFAAVAASLMLLLWASAPGGVANSLIASRWTGIQESIQSRAKVELSEDFQGGMQDWTGRPGWDQSWRLEKAGYMRPGHLALYQPSMQMESYRMEFLVEIEKQAVGWVYRATDQENYYAAKITIVKPGPLPVLSLVRYPVIGGKKGPRVEVPIRVLMHNNTPYRVQLTVNGMDFSTSIEGQLVDFWRDDRLKTGGVGFFSDTGDRARIYWMKVARQEDFVGRVCAYFYPNPTPEKSIRKPQ